LFKKSLTLLLLPILFLLWSAGPAYAQASDDQAITIDWRELETEKFLVVYAENVRSVDENRKVSGRLRREC
jgi:hypothetical protein